MQVIDSGVTKFEPGGILAEVGPTTNTLQNIEKW